MRPRKDKPDYCLHRPSGRAYVRIDGRFCWLGKHGTPESRDRYDVVIGQWKAGGRTLPPPARVKVSPGTAAADMGPTLTTAIEAYWEHAQTYYRKNGRPTDEVGCVKVAMRLWRKHYGDEPAAAFDSLKLIALQLHMIRTGWARKTINDHVGRVKRALKWMVSRKLVPAMIYLEASTVTGLEKGRSDAKETDPKRPVPDEHVEATLRFLSRPVAALVRLQILSGARPGELLPVRKCDIDMREGGKPWVYVPREHKTEHHDHDRRVYFGPEAQAVLRPFLMRPDDAPLFSPRESQRERREARAAARKTPKGQGNGPGDSRVRRPKRAAGTAYTVDSYRRSIARACDLADAWAKGGRVVGNDERVVAHWHPHRLRHNSATRIRSKFGAEAAKVSIGVKNMDVAELYAERDFAMVERIMAEVG